MASLLIKATISAAIVLVPCPAIAQQEVDRCRTVAELLGRDESQSLYSLKLAEELHTNICSGKQTKSGLDLSGNAKFVVDMIPASMGGAFSSRREKAEHFCSTHDSSKTTDLYQSGSSSVVVRQAIDAWLQCAVLNKEVFINIKPTQSTASFFFDVKRGHEDATFKGVKVTEGNIFCTSTFKDANSPLKTQTVDRDTLTELSPNTLSIACTRPSVTTNDGFSYLPQTAFLIDTSRGSMPVVLPRDAHLGPVYASELASQISQLRAENMALGERLAKVTAWLHDELEKPVIIRNAADRSVVITRHGEGGNYLSPYPVGQGGLGTKGSISWIIDRNQ